MHVRAQRICIMFKVSNVGAASHTSRGQAVHFNRWQEADVSRSSRVRVCMLVVHVCVCMRARVLCCVVREGAIYRQTGREKK